MNVDIAAVMKDFTLDGTNQILPGLGDEFDAGKLEAYPPGAVIVLPGNTSHFHWAKSGAYIAQVTAIGPLGFEYVNSKDEPRDENSTR